MWERARSLLDRADRLQKNFFAPQRPGTRRPSWEPPVDMFESENELWILVALPGVSAASVAIELSPAGLLVCGERALPQVIRSAMVHRLEIPHGRFERRVALPAGTYEIRRRELEGGCLTLVLTKVA